MPVTPRGWRSISSMGRCHDFGVQVGRDCEHPMQPGENACSCPHCDSVCEGQFKGCADVWVRGPRAVQVASPALFEQIVENGQVDGSGSGATIGPLVSDGRPAGGGTVTREAPDTALNVLAWPDMPVKAVRAELEALSTAMAQQQAVVSQLVNGYGDLRRASENESLLLVVRTVVEGAVERFEAARREDSARDSRRLNEVVGQVQELLAAQRTHQESMTAVRDDLRSELHDALREEKAELSGQLAAVVTALDDAFGKVTKLATELSAATIREVRDANTYANGSVSELRESIAELQKSAEVERQGDRQIIGQWLYAVADSMGKAVREAVTRAAGESEARIFDRLDTAVEQLQHSINDVEAASERHRMEADRAEGERMRELHASLAELSDALRGTHALAAAQQEETDLLDGAMRTLQESLVDLRTSVAAQHVEIREDLARQRRSSSELIKRQLRPITESLPKLAATAGHSTEEATLERVETAVAELRRSLEQAQAPRSEAHK